MRMGAADIKKYTKLAYYVKNDLPKITSSPSIAHAMNKIGQINKARLSMALKWKSGPTIKIAVLVGALGEFTPGIGSNEVRISKKAVEDFEAGKGVRKARAGNVYLVGVTLLHELIHWGDDRDGVDRAGEEGAEFERSVYGSVIY